MKIYPLMYAYQQFFGAMFRASLRDDLLAFIYPFPAERCFHTFFCPPLRMVALDARGEVVCDRVIPPGKLVLLPESRLVLEMDADMDYTASLPQLRALLRDPRAASMGGHAPCVRVERLLLALFVGALTDLRSVRDRQVYQRGNLDIDALRSEYPAWRRGRIFTAAALINDLAGMATWEIPREALKMSSQIVMNEFSYVAELFSASVAGSPWKTDEEFNSGEVKRCLKCGKRACSWHFVLKPFPDMPPETMWRLERPENAVPICGLCAYELGFCKDEAVRTDLAWGLWGPRFSALLNWYKALQTRALPAGWEREAYPLWPSEYGGKTWGEGSGAFEVCDPIPFTGVSADKKDRYTFQVINQQANTPGICRSEEHLQALRRVLSTKGGKPRYSETSPVWTMLN